MSQPTPVRTLGSAMAPGHSPPRRYLIVGGPTASGGRSELLVWDGRSAPRAFSAMALPGLNPEAFVSPESAQEFLLLSDDGERLGDGVPCKRLKDPARKRFRALRVPLAALD